MSDNTLIDCIGKVIRCVRALDQASLVRNVILLNRLNGCFAEIGKGKLELGQEDLELIMRYRWAQSSLAESLRTLEEQALELRGEKLDQIEEIKLVFAAIEIGYPDHERYDWLREEEERELGKLFCVALDEALPQYAKDT